MSTVMSINYTPPFEDPTTPVARAWAVGTEHGRTAAEAWLAWEPTYAPWRHGGWYVDGTTYPNGGCGCVSRNYPDRKWRIVCDPRPDGYEHTYRTRDEAARAEHALCVPEPRVVGDSYDAMCRREEYGLTTNANVMGAYCTAFARARDEVLARA